MNPDDHAWDVECNTHGLIEPAYNRPDITRVITDHWTARHGGVGAAIEGRDWTAYPAVRRCDTCSIPLEPPTWAHHLAVPHEDTAVEDLDGIWHLCGTCHQLLQEKKLIGLVRRSVEIAHIQRRTELVGTREDETTYRAYAASVMSHLIEHLDAGTLTP